VHPRREDEGGLRPMAQRHGDKGEERRSQNERAYATAACAGVATCTVHGHVQERSATVLRTTEQPGTARCQGLPAMS